MDLNSNSEDIESYSLDSPEMQSLVSDPLYCLIQTLMKNSVSTDSVLAEAFKRFEIEDLHRVLFQFNHHSTYDSIISQFLKKKSMKPAERSFLCKLQQLMYPNFFSQISIAKPSNSKAKEIKKVYLFKRFSINKSIEKMLNNTLNGNMSKAEPIKVLNIRGPSGSGKTLFLQISLISYIIEQRELKLGRQKRIIVIDQKGRFDYESLKRAFIFLHKNTEHLFSSFDYHRYVTIVSRLYELKQLNTFLLMLISCPNSINKVEAIIIDDFSLFLRSSSNSEETNTCFLYLGILSKQTEKLVLSTTPQTVNYNSFTNQIDYNIYLEKEKSINPTNNEKRPNHTVNQGGLSGLDQKVYHVIDSHERKYLISQMMKENMGRMNFASLTDLSNPFKDTSDSILGLDLLRDMIIDINILLEPEMSSFHFSSSIRKYLSLSFPKQVSPSFQLDYLMQSESTDFEFTFLNNKFQNVD